MHPQQPGREKFYYYSSERSVNRQAGGGNQLSFSRKFAINKQGWANKAKRTCQVDRKVEIISLFSRKVAINKQGCANKAKRTCQVDRKVI